MVRRLLIAALIVASGTAATHAQIVTSPSQLPQLAPGPAASPYTPSAPAIAPGPAAPGTVEEGVIAPGPAAPPMSVSRRRHHRETPRDRIVRCTHYGTSIGIRPNHIGSYAAQCAQAN